MGKAVWKILGTGSAVLAGLLATKVADVVWRKAGQDRVDPKNPEVPMKQAVAYAALTGLATGAAKTMVTRKAARYYQSLPDTSPRRCARTSPRTTDRRATVTPPAHDRRPVVERSTAGRHLGSISPV